MMKMNKFCFVENYYELNNFNVVFHCSIKRHFPMFWKRKLTIKVEYDKNDIAELNVNRQTLEKTILKTIEKIAEEYE